MEEALDRADHDTGRGDQNQGSLEPAREVLGLGVTVGVILVCGARGDPERDQRDHGRGQVHQRLERIGQEADRAGEEIRSALERDGDERRDYGKSGVSDEPGPTNHPRSSGSIRATSATVSGALPSARLFTRR